MFTLIQYLQNVIIAIASRQGHVLVYTIFCVFSPVVNKLDSAERGC